PASSPPTPSSISSGACARSSTSTGRPRDGVDPGRPEDRVTEFLPLDWTGVHPPAIAQAAVPAHVAIVMDGNGRWANRRGLPRIEGHRAGEASLLDVVAGAIQ